MHRSARMVPLFAFAVLLLHPPVGAPRSERAADPAAVTGIPASALTPSVRVQHELVRLPKAKPQPQRVKRPSQWRSTRLAMKDTPPSSRPPLLVRASRALIGDGRYKPEPFPKLDR